MKKYCLSLLLMAGFSANAYDILDRFVLFEDRLKILEELNPYGEDFVVPLDIYAAVSPDSQDLKDDADKVSKLGVSNITEANAILNKYDKSEHLIHLKPLNMNIRLPRFTIAQWDFVPALRVKSSVGFLIGIRNEAFSLNGETALLFMPSDLQTQLPAATINYIKGQTYTAGAQIIPNCAAAGIPDPSPLCVEAQKHYMPSVDSPTLRVYGKAEAKAGFHFNYYSPAFKAKGDHYFYGEFFPYASMRSDIKVFAATDTLVRGTNPIDGYKPADRIQNFVFLDYRLGYKMKPFNVFFAAEEIKLMEGSDDSKKTAFENDPLLRLHGDADFKFSVVKLQPFAGFHLRSNYGVSDGMYVGLQAGFSFWGDRFKFLPKAVFDKEYFTLGLNLKIWIIHLDPYIKVAVKSENDGVKSPDIFGLNLRVVQF
jgi:hypothetical protein